MRSARHRAARAGARRRGRKVPGAPRGKRGVAISAGRGNTVDVRCGRWCRECDDETQWCRKGGGRGHTGIGGTTTCTFPSQGRHAGAPGRLAFCATAIHQTPQEPVYGEAGNACSGLLSAAAAPIGLSPLPLALSLDLVPLEAVVPLGLSSPSALDPPVLPMLTPLHPCVKSHLASSACPPPPARWFPC